MERSQATLVAGEESHIVAEAAERILADLADPQSINQASNGAWKAPLSLGALTVWFEWRERVFVFPV